MSSAKRFISNDRRDESPEAKARWFQSLTLEERMALLCEYTELILANTSTPGLTFETAWQNRIAMQHQGRRFLLFQGMTSSPRSERRVGQSIWRMCVFSSCKATSRQTDL